MMMATSKYRGGYSYKSPKTSYRSGLEQTIAQVIKINKHTLRYEELKLSYEIPASKHTYTPDFVLDNGIIIESKGIFESDDRAKHRLIRQQYPHLDIRFVFSNANKKLYKGSPTTYAQWCNKYGFKYSNKTIPSSWFKEPKRDTKGLIEKGKK